MQVTVTFKFPSYHPDHDKTIQETKLSSFEAQQKGLMGWGETVEVAMKMLQPQEHEMVELTIQGAAEGEGGMSSFCTIHVSHKGGHVVWWTVAVFDAIEYIMIRDGV